MMLHRTPVADRSSVDHTDAFVAACRRYGARVDDDAVTDVVCSGFNLAALHAAHCLIESTTALERRLVGDVRCTDGDLRLLEQDVTRSLSSCTADVQALQQHADTAGRSANGRACPNRMDHYRGVIAILYLRLSKLAELLNVLRSVRSDAGRDRAAAQAYVDEPDAGDMDGDDSNLPRRAVPLASMRMVVSRIRDAAPAPAASRPAAATAAGSSSGTGTGSAAAARARGEESTSAASAAAGTSAAAAGGQVQALMPREQVQRGAVSATIVEERMVELSSMLTFISDKLLEQAEDVQSIMEASAESRENMSKAKRELTAATSRPRTMRDFMIIVLLLMTLVLWFLHWFYP